LGIPFPPAGNPARASLAAKRKSFPAFRTVHHGLVIFKARACPYFSWTERVHFVKLKVNRLVIENWEGEKLRNLQTMQFLA
jgi:hypothetical protein